MSYFILEKVSESVELGIDSCSVYEDLMERGKLIRVDQKARYSGQRGLQAVQDLNDLCLDGLFLLNTPLRVSKQGIDSSVSLALTIIDLEVVAREFLGLTDLSGAQTLCLHELIEVVEFGKYKHLMFRPV